MAKRPKRHPDQPFTPSQWRSLRKVMVRALNKAREHDPRVKALDPGEFEHRLASMAVVFRVAEYQSAAGKPFDLSGGRVRYGPPAFFLQ